MDYKEYKREEMQEDHIRDEYYEQNKKEFLVTFKGTIYVEAIDAEDAIEKAQNNPDILEYVDDWMTS